MNACSHFVCVLNISAGKDFFLKKSIYIILCCKMVYVFTKCGTLGSKLHRKQQQGQVDTGTRYGPQSGIFSSNRNEKRE